VCIVCLIMGVLWDNISMEMFVLFVWSYDYYEIIPLWKCVYCLFDQNISMEVLSHNAPMIKQTIQTFPCRYYLIMPLWSNKQYNGNVCIVCLIIGVLWDNTSMEVFVLFVWSWGYSEIIPPWKCLYCLFDHRCMMYKHFHGSIIS
jgi:hypothetical protein